MQMQIINEELFIMEHAINLNGIYQKASILHRMDVQNRRKAISKAVKDLRKSLTASPGYLKFLQEVDSLKEKNADKDEKGNPRRSPQGFIISENLDKHMMEIMALREKYKKEIEAMQKVEQQYFDVLIPAKSKIKIAPLYLTDFDPEITTFIELYGLANIIDWNKEGFPGKKAKKKVKIKIVDLVGDLYNSKAGWLDVTVSQIGNFDYWPIAVKLAYNLYQMRLKFYELRNNKIYLDFIEKYEKPRVKLAKAHAELDLNGEPRQNQQGSYTIINMAKFSAALEKLKTADVVNPWIEWSENEVELNLIKITPSELKGLDKYIQGLDSEQQGPGPKKEDVLLSPAVVETIGMFV